MPNAAGGWRSTHDTSPRVGTTLAQWRGDGLVRLLVLLSIWIVTHAWGGIRHDGVLYAGQAMLHLNPHVFGGDLFFAWGSQDDFTIFGRVYAIAAARFGLADGALILWVLSQVLWFAVACAWLRGVAPAVHRLPVAAAMFALPAYYGSEVIFRLAEPFLTARSFAEPLVLAGILASARGHRLTAAGLLLLAAAVHPIMALPGVLCALAQPWLSPIRWRALRDLLRANRSPAARIAGLAVSILVTFGGVALLTRVPGFLDRIDEHWLELVRQRSNLVVVSAWHALDWMRMLLPLSIVALSARRAGDRWAPTWAAIALCGALGLALALVSSLARWKFGLQAQFFRLAWPAVWFAPLLALAAASGLPRASAAHRILLLAAVPALALVSQGWWNGAWILAAAYLLLLAAAASGRLPETSASKRLALAVAALLGAAALTDGFATLYVRLVVMDPSADFDASTTALVVEKFGWLVFPALLLAAQRDRGTRSAPRAVMALAAAMVALAAWSLDGRSPARAGFERLIGSGGQGWAQVIPGDATVFWPQHLDRVWLVLGRRSYVSRGQLAGGVFGRDVVIEGNRRARNVEVLELGDEAIRPKVASRPAKAKPLERADVERACTDPVLDFIILQRDVGPNAAVPHVDPVTGRIYHLYRCDDFRVS